MKISIKITGLLFVISLHLFYVTPAYPGEGMWIPMLLEQLNEKEMKSMGMKFSASDIYNINKSSMKDAVVLFGRGCTAEMVSTKGLILTNHHCGLGRIQQHSSIEHDYITDGFWAMKPEEELPNPGLSVTLLKWMEDVSDSVLSGIKINNTEKEREELINNNIKNIIDNKTRDTHYEGIIKPFYNGNVYYLFVVEVFKDVRLVGAPPSFIGKFGGDTDNWMWPRHTGDFSVFRIYADSNNKPAEYNESNIPYEPAWHFPVSLKGYEEGDFTMVFGYPGSTQQFITSDGVRLVTETENPIRIKARDKRLEIMDIRMKSDELVNIQYTSKHAGVANGWKKWIGENRGLKKLHAISKKEKFEKEFQEWVDADETRHAKYGTLLSEIDKKYIGIKPARRAQTLLRETGLSIELLRFSDEFSELAALSQEKDVNHQELEKELNRLKSRIKAFFKDYDLVTDKLIAVDMLNMLYKDMEASYLPQEFHEIGDKNQGNFTAYVDKLYNSSIFFPQQKILTFIDNYKTSSVKKITKDPVYILSGDLFNHYYEEIIPGLQKDFSILDSLYRLYTSAIMEMKEGERMYPDANLTLRVAYGKVEPYQPADAVKYEVFTTLEGIFEKAGTGVYDYVVDEKLLKLFETKDYGKYAASDGKLHTCFIASNHTTGGNSGSPLLNAEGALIGINFDRNWEGTMSDIMYDPDQCRNISLDIRYCLFIIDKYADAGHLIDEMTIIE